MTQYRGWQGEALYNLIAADNGARWIVQRRSRLDEQVTDTWTFDNRADALAQVLVSEEDGP